MFPDFPITIFPQTIYFTSKSEENRAALILESHPDLTLLCRDTVSYNKAKEFLKRTNLLLYPDIVTSLIGNYAFKGRREGILLCKRNDKESFYSNSEIDNLLSCLNKITQTHITDTTLNINYRNIIKNRKKYLENIFLQYSKYSTVITDRYHGMIFSLIAGTPVIIIKTNDHKLTSGLNWFSHNIFKEYVSIAENLNDAYDLALINIKNPVKNILPAYFQENYFNTLIDHLHL
jgi:exopolysaccharide biosynthesis predicted pyruvyltransferase EpsI